MITIKIFKWLQSFLRDNWKNFHRISVLLILLFLPFVANDYNQKWKKSLKVTTFRNYTPQNQKNFAFFAIFRHHVKFNSIFFSFHLQFFLPSRCGRSAAGVKHTLGGDQRGCDEAAAEEEERHHGRMARHGFWRKEKEKNKRRRMMKWETQG